MRQFGDYANLRQRGVDTSPAPPATQRLVQNNGPLYGGLLFLAACFIVTTPFLCGIIWPTPICCGVLPLCLIGAALLMDLTPARP